MEKVCICSAGSVHDCVAKGIQIYIPTAHIPQSWSTSIFITSMLIESAVGLTVEFLVDMLMQKYSYQENEFGHGVVKRPF